MQKVLKLLTLALMMFIGNNGFAQGNMQDVMYLKNGSIVRGIIIEQVPNVSYKIQTIDGSVFVYEVDNVEKITKEKPLNNIKIQNNNFISNNEGLFIRAGYNLMNYSGNDVANTERKIGYSLIIGYRTNLYSEKKFILVYSFELGPRSKGFAERYKKIKKSFIAHNFQVSPINLSGNFRLSNKILFDIHTGIYASFDYYGKLTEKSKYYNIKESYDIYDIKNYIYVDAGINLGAGVWINNFNIDFTFTKGGVPMRKGFKATSNNLIFNLGYKF